MELLSATIKWHDEPDVLATTIAIHPNWTEDDDDPRVFFYFPNKAEMYSAREPEPNGFEFQIIDVEENGDLD